jgi:hypothetical protein
MMSHLHKIVELPIIDVTLNDTPEGRSIPGRPIGRPGVGHSQGTIMNFRVIVPSHPPKRDNIVSFGSPNFSSGCVSLPTSGTTSSSVKRDFRELRALTVEDNAAQFRNEFRDMYNVAFPVVEDKKKQKERDKP